MGTSIELKDVSFSYDQSSPVLDIKSLIINSGEKLFIHGPSGSGKSTLLNLIAGVIDPQSGTIGILGTEFSSLSIGQKDQFRGEHIGFVFQNFNLVPYLTIYENIILPLKSSKKRNSKIPNGLEAEVQRITSHLKIDGFLNKRVTELSIGQQQRVAVARALIGDPEIIIADEPTSSLDDDVTDGFMKLLLEEHQRKQFTLLFVSHDKRLSKYFDREIPLAQVNAGGNEGA